uniref:SRCR domain-containing protein n=1 Tax=Amphimedon queenslandica TaxID=400682 RepID=A0A1X7T3T8_AMPQE
NNYWNNIEADVACFQLGYYSYGHSFSRTTTSRMFPLIYSYFNCHGNEVTLLSCSSGLHSSIQYCTNNAVKLNCEANCTSGDMRLVSGGYYYGRVEVCVEGIWGTICRDSYWDNNDASVVCRQLGFSPYGSIAVTSSWNNEERGITFLTGLNCNGTEENIFDCLIDANAPICSSNWADANVVCPAHGVSTYSNCTDGNIRLIGGSTKYEGRVEVCINNAWGTAYGYSSDYFAQTVCNTLGFSSPGAIYLFNTPFGEGSGPILMYAYCYPAENSLLDCYSWPQYIPDARHESDASVRCEIPCENGDIRLVGGTDPLVGRVELCVYKTWGTICDDYWDDNDASVVPYQHTIAILRGNCHLVLLILIVLAQNNIFLTVHIAVHIYITAKTVQQSNCTDSEVRLVDGSGSHEGRVEVCINEAWGTVCSNGWTNTDANVVCKQLGYLPIGGRARSSSDHFGPGVGPILMASVDCTGNEESLIECRTRSCDATTCSHYNDAGVTCERTCTDGEIRLGDYAVLRGRVEVCINNTWTTICASYWTDKEATVICFQLGYSRYGAGATYGVFIDNEWPIGIYVLNCTGDEVEIWECMHHTNGSMHGLDCSQGTDASVFCMSNNTQHVNCTNGDVRLVGGDIMNEGNVQICYNNAWGSVCDNQWDSSDSNVVCYQLGLQPFGSQSFANNYFSVNDNPSFVIGALSCSGSEESLLDCSRHITSGASINCQSHEVAGVRCI